MKKILNLKYLLIVFVYLFVAGCSDMEKSQKDRSILTSVEIDEFSSKNVPSISKNQTILQGIGPASPRGKAEHGKNKNLPVNCLVLGPGINKTSAYISIFRALEKRKIKLHVISGYGFSSIVASLYAMGLTADAIEWKLFKFMRELKEQRAFSSEWKEILGITLLKEFDKLSIEKLAIKLAIPLWDRKYKRMIFKSRGDLRSSINANIALARRGAKKRYLNPLEGNIFDPKSFKKLGCDIIFGADVIGKNITFNKADGYLVGIFGKAATNVEDYKNTFNAFFQLKDLNYPLDENKNLADFMRSSIDFGNEAAEVIQKMNTDWVKEK